MPPATNQNQYDFFLEPPVTPKRSLLSRLSLPGNSFNRRLMLIGGSSLILVVVIILVGILLGGNGSTEANLTRIAALQNEITTISSTAVNQASQSSTQNLAVNAVVSLSSARDQLASLAAKFGSSLPINPLPVNAAAITSRLSEAVAASQYDPVYVTVMQSELTAYRQALSAGYNGTKNSSLRLMLTTDYSGVKLLLDQANAVAANLAYQ